MAYTWTKQVKRSKFYRVKRVLVFLLLLSVIYLFWLAIFDDSENCRQNSDIFSSIEIQTSANDSFKSRSFICRFLALFPANHVLTFLQLLFCDNNVFVFSQKEDGNVYGQCNDPFLPTFQREKRFICITIDGGLGNQMFLFASAYGIAKQTGRHLVIYRQSPLLEVFRLDSTTIVNICVCLNVKIKNSKLHCSFDETLFSIPNDGNYEVKRYLQSWKYFENYTQEVKKQFTFKTYFILRAAGILNQAKDKCKNVSINKQHCDNPTFIGVHVREPDKNAKQFVGYNVAPKEYIYRAMNYFENKFKSVIFVVVSNILSKAKEKLQRQNNTYFVEGYIAPVDMSVLALCNHTIITVGTFGWFSAFLAGGSTVYYKHPHKQDSEVRKQYSADYKDFFYPDWIAME